MNTSNTRRTVRASGSTTPKFIALLAGALLGIAFAPCAHADLYWDGNGTASGFQAADGDFGTSAYWNGNSTGVGTLATWTASSIATINGNTTNNMTVNSAVTAGNVYLDNLATSGTSTTVNLSGSSTLNATNLAVGWTTNGNASTATAILNQSGGNITAGGIYVGRYGTNGTYNLTGGNVTCTGTLT